eukprot:CAMPEP_0194736102 /NCGR_PEP_ID=MMETSP0296-20130528/76157_1 /TAXON_ID=39354 /ORGANISM="Heterosigma akashiwo, Strain CCMP2393" /LENGTH=64 /DNA_ID=CAMNT_0039645553 /DNA_START=1 /DNA_END=191 /DNA_ORIENTATION=+
MTLVVVVSWLIMFDEKGGTGIEILEIIIMILFSAEVLWKSTAFGFYSGPQAFLKSRWNWVDLLL